MLISLFLYYLFFVVLIDSGVPTRTIARNNNSDRPLLGSKIKSYERPKANALAVLVVLETRYNRVRRLFGRLLINRTHALRRPRVRLAVVFRYRPVGPIFYLRVLSFIRRPSLFARFDGPIMAKLIAAAILICTVGDTIDGTADPLASKYGRLVFSTLVRIARIYRAD